MKWLRTLVLFDKGDVISSEDWREIHASYVRSIEKIDHPCGTGILKLKRKERKPNKKWSRNGVGYLRSRFLSHMLNDEKWNSEGVVALARDRDQPFIRLFPSREEYREPITSDFGGFDFATTTPSGLKVAIEWETGNISSSHRSMNKLAIALRSEVLQVGILIVPSRRLYEHLTDRIGNIGEISGYIALWEGVKATVKHGLLAITVVEHDELTDDATFPYLPVGNDGRAAEGRNR
jgi:hypothetical protein